MNDYRFLSGAQDLLCRAQLLGPWGEYLWKLLKRCLQIYIVSFMFKDIKTWSFSIYMEDKRLKVVKRSDRDGRESRTGTTLLLHETSRLGLFCDRIWWEHQDRKWGDNILTCHMLQIQRSPTQHPARTSTMSASWWLPLGRGALTSLWRRPWSERPKIIHFHPSAWREHYLISLCLGCLLCVRLLVILIVFDFQTRLWLQCWSRSDKKRPSKWGSCIVFRLGLIYVAWTHFSA